MSNKFKYAPGKPGFGSKGDRGTDGVQGLSMYFTDFDPLTQSILINSRIQNNQSLWSTNPPPSLPEGRVYKTGDLFFDEDGKTYEIDAENNTFSYKFASLNRGGFFLPIGYETNEGYLRYFNSNSGTKYIIDNVYTNSGAVDYTQAPSFIYSINPGDFTRIEYTNVKPDDNYNAFTAYTIGRNDNEALALVYDEMTSTFRLGNLDAAGIIRNTNLTFDVSVLKVTKQEGVNTFNSNTPEGAVLTNYEIAANSLFDPNFNRLPDSFTYQISTSDCSIIWNLSDFIDDSDVKADLYFYEQILNYDACVFKIDSSLVRPLVFHDIDTSASVRITGLREGKPYGAYIKFFKNGWARTSDIQLIMTGLLNVVPNTRSYSSSIINDGSVNVTSSVPWSISITSNPSTFMTDFVCTSVGSGPSPNDGVIYFDLSANPGINRVGEFKVIPVVGASKDISIYQQGDTVTTPVTFTNGTDQTYGNLYSQTNVVEDYVDIPTLPVTSVVDLSIYFSWYANSFGGQTNTWHAWYEIRRTDNTLISSDHLSNTLASGNYTSGSSLINITNIQKSYLPLKLKVTATVEAGTGGYPTGSGTTESQLSGINFKYSSGTTVYVENLSSYIGSQAATTLNYS